MKNILIAVLALASLTMMTGCSKDAEIQALITEMDGVTKDIVTAIDANPNTKGVEAAQKAFDGRKDALKSKFEAVKSATGIQVSDDMKKKLEESVTKDMKAIVDLADKHAMEIASDPGAADKFKKLMDDFGAIFK